MTLSSKFTISINCLFLCLVEINHFLDGWRTWRGTPKILTKQDFGRGESPTGPVQEMKITSLG